MLMVIGRWVYLLQHPVASYSTDESLVRTSYEYTEYTGQNRAPHFKRAAFTLRLCPSDQYCTKTVRLLEALRF